MPMVQVSLDKLRDSGLDVVAEMWLEEMSRVVRDLCERPGHDSVRSVTLEWKLKPVKEQSGVCTEALAVVTCSARLPKQRTRTLNFELSANGALMARPGSLDNHRQMTLDDAKEE